MANRTGAMHYSGISIQGRYKAPRGRDGAKAPLRGDSGLIGPGVCRILDTDFREHVFHALR